MNDLSLLNELEQKIVGLVTALKKEQNKNVRDNANIVESQKLSKIEEHAKKMINILDKMLDE